MKINYIQIEYIQNNNMILYGIDIIHIIHMTYNNILIKVKYKLTYVKINSLLLV